MEAGFLTDLLEADPRHIDRAKLREVLMLSGYPVTPHYDLSAIEAWKLMNSIDQPFDMRFNYGGDFIPRKNNEVNPTIHLLPVGSIMTYDQGLKLLAKRGFRPANLWEISDFAIQNPSQWQTKKIVCLNVLQGRYFSKEKYEDYLLEIWSNGPHLRVYVSTQTAVSGKLAGEQLSAHVFLAGVKTN